MVRKRSVFFCGECGHESARWLGKCPGCGAWNSFVEGQNVGLGTGGAGPREKPVALDRIETGSSDRLVTGLGEFDRVLGGGIVPGTAVLVGGDPGIGKSTLLLQVSDALAGKGEAVLYVSGEESGPQLKMRAGRLGIDSSSIIVLMETDVRRIIEEAGSLSLGALVLDSIQTVRDPDAAGAPGSASQIRESAGQLVRFAKQEQVPVFLIGHVTKEGAIAGPRVLEHMVDTVLYFEGDRRLSYRILRAVKNRFGSTDEIGVFEMTASGLAEVPDPSALFVSSGSRGASGSIVIACVEGTRALTVELQALVGLTNFAVPQRSSTGVDRRRVPLILAVLERRGGLSLGNRDVFVSIAGGVRVEEPAGDLGIALAVASSYWDVPVDPDVAVFGEIGLAGEIRPVSVAGKRIHEAARLGYGTVVLPAACAAQVGSIGGVKLVGVEYIAETMDLLLGGRRGKAAGGASRVREALRSGGSSAGRGRV